jgi:hypothetical protein
VALESDAVYVTHIGELARIQERGREILDGGDMSDFEALRSYQSIVLENLTVLSKVVGGRGLFGSQGHVGRPLGIHV